MSTLYRTTTFTSRDVDADTRTVNLSFSSETPCERDFGFEILGHNPDEVDLSRLHAGAPLLNQHSPMAQIGVIDNAWLQNQTGRAVVRFSRNKEADDIYRDVLDGIKRNVSVGYNVDSSSMKAVSTDSRGVKTYRVTRWQPMEVSMVSMPLDNTVGVGRQWLDRRFTNEFMLVRFVTGLRHYGQWYDAGREMLASKMEGAELLKLRDWQGEPVVEELMKIRFKKTVLWQDAWRRPGEVVKTNVPQGMRLIKRDREGEIVGEEICLS